MPAKSSQQTAFNDTLRSIASEVSEFVPNDPSHPENGLQMVSKAEALCRSLFKMALGYETKKKVKDIETTVIHQPEKWAIKEIMDRVDGRTNVTADAGDNSTPLADRIRQQSKKLINDLASEGTNVSNPS